MVPLFLEEIARSKTDDLLKTGEHERRAKAARKARRARKSLPNSAVASLTALGRAFR